MISIVIPTYNEVQNLPILLSRLDKSMGDFDHEYVIVDDNSPDGTGKKAEELKSRYPLSVIHREKKLGLASAVIAGFEQTSGDILGFMDADLSHPPELISTLISEIIDGGMDIVLASRLMEGSAVIGNWPQHRKLNSYMATMIASPLTSVRDSMSGYFLFKREVIRNAKLVPRGYKIGLEILVKGDYKEVREIPFIFDNRVRGKSKLTLKVQIDYMVQICDLYFFVLKKALNLL